MGMKGEGDEGEMQDGKDESVKVLAVDEFARFAMCTASIRKNMAFSEENKSKLNFFQPVVKRTIFSRRNLYNVDRSSSTSSASIQQPPTIFGSY
jgi:hypothetical protein